MTAPLARLAVAGTAETVELSLDFPLLRDALTELGIAATHQVWSDPQVQWSNFDLVLANCCWDHIHRAAEFSAWIDRTAPLVPLANSPATLHWGMEKHYLSALADAGVATVPTTWLSPTEGIDENDVPLPQGDFVIKPALSGGGFQTARYRASEHQQARDHINQLLDNDRHVMVQPYIERVDADGEGGLIFLGGQFSHAICKSPLLRHDVGPQAGLWENQVITPLEPTPAQLEVGHAALAAAEQLLGPTTYARADLIPLDDGTPAVLELELVDPVLFFDIEPAGAVRFARVLANLIEIGPEQNPVQQ